MERRKTLVLYRLRPTRPSNVRGDQSGLGTEGLNLGARRACLADQLADQLLRPYRSVNRRAPLVKRTATNAHTGQSRGIQCHPQPLVQ